MLPVLHQEQADVRWIEINDTCDRQEVKLAFTCRSGGYSVAPYNSLNMAIHVGDVKDVVMKNRQKILSVFNIDISNSVSAEQIHKDSIHIVNKHDIGKGTTDKSPIPETDGLITTEFGIALLSFYADCVPIYVWDVTRGIIGIAHAGWKGTVLDIGGKMVENFSALYNSELSNIKIAIGPSICSNCYEVDDNVINKYKSLFNENELNLIYSCKSEGKYLLDLRKANEILLLKRGILSKHILHMNQCTSCNPDLFFSYRYNQGDTGRMAAIIMQKRIDVKHE
ncbi:peptidoglycan editing factor PgeF [Desulfuribacillus alkaliarsenatis]|uniref:Purine nucleoside phosphorylase n=1 Tax=Desulfuribacillus alkaliarsenatis TaxID=766136 RepID=A0A1E5FZT1_9FIRM|nr:peptidoglycan editing factor PgeF [Desulfuribacillus alkaliarsenatis]OEF96064.1 hypothetical protein BHF68_10010 [Desulfuribacillus alkaliarsenatis]